jgi:hypothetical protein
MFAKPVYLISLRSFIPFYTPNLFVKFEGLTAANIVISSQVLFHNGSLLQSRLNTQLLITVHSSSKNLTPV